MNWTTGVLADFRAELACQWLGHDITYLRMMRRRLQNLRRAGWFTWTYQKGVKTPYDITMRQEGSAARQCTASTPGDLSATTLGEQINTNGAGKETIFPPPAVTVLPTLSSQYSGAPRVDVAVVADLKKRIYKATGGEMIDRVLTLSQISTLLACHSSNEVVFAIMQRREVITDTREFHRSLRSFLLDGGVKIEIDEAREEFRRTLKNINGTYWASYTNGKRIAETAGERDGRIERWLSEHDTECDLFPEVMISDGGDAAIMLAEQKAWDKTQQETQAVSQLSNGEMEKTS